MCVVNISIFILSGSLPKCDSHVVVSSIAYSDTPWL